MCRPAVWQVLLSTTTSRMYSGKAEYLTGGGPTAGSVLEDAVVRKQPPFFQLLDKNYTEIDRS